MKRSTNKRKLDRKKVAGIVIAIILLCESTFVFSGIMPDTGVNLKIEKEWKGYYSGYTKAERLVIKTEEQWREVWKRVYSLRLPKPELPEIDFQKDMVIAVFMGERTSVGYSIEITEITKRDEEILVSVEEKEPPSESIRAMALTQPYHIVVVRRLSLPVRFQDP